MIDWHSISRRMPRKRYSEGTLDTIGTGKDKRWRGYWFVYVMVDGKEVRRKREKVLGPATMPKHEARAELIHHILESRGELPPPPENPTVAKLWDRYCAHKSGAWSKITRKTLVSLFKPVTATIGNVEVADLTIGPIQAILNSMAASGKSESALKKVRTHTKAMLEFAVDERLITANPARKLTVPKKGVPKPSHRFYSLDECHALIKAATGREHLMFRLLLVAGLRSQELFLLRANDLENGAIRVDEAFKSCESGKARIGTTKTDGVEGVPDLVAIPHDLEKELRDWIRTQHIAHNGLLFEASRGGGPIDPSNHLERVLQPLAAGVGIQDLTYQALRRTCATYFRSNIKGAQQQLRHSKPHVTAQHYQQVITAEHRQAVADLDRELCAPPKPKVVKLKKRA
jgi:integrase